MNNSPPALRTTEWYALHETAIAIHRAPSIESACRVVSTHLHDHGLAYSVRAVIAVDEPSRSRSLIASNSYPLPTHREEAHLAKYEVSLPTQETLKLEIGLPDESNLLAQMMIEILLEHLDLTCRAIDKPTVETVSSTIRQLPS